MDDLIQNLTITPRVTWNAKTDLKHAIKHLSWQLNVNINYITIRRSPTICAHSYRNVLVYVFQNTYLKLLRHCEIAPLNILVYKKRVYIINRDITIYPKLINEIETSQLSYRNTIITPEIILGIINEKITVGLPFNINVYTSYTYMNTTSTSTITNHMLGQYRANSADHTIHIFISPTLAGDGFSMHQLNNITNNKNIQKEPLYANPRLQEGNKTLFPHSDHLPKPLNNTHCVCDHPKLDVYFPPRHKAYKNLGT